jgi:methylenetetrahydrofolate--tRNA-(uracil-5-)-methyltransferase
MKQRMPVRMGGSWVTIVGAGLAGCEAALSLARLGHEVRLCEQKPIRRSPAHVSDDLGELVCSNSFRGSELTTAVGLLKEELRRAGSFVVQAADKTRIPAGGALAVDRARFSHEITRWVHDCPRIEVVVGEVERLPKERPAIIATGPLTSESLAHDLAERLGREALAYYDAIAPVVAAESIDRSRVFCASRYGKGESEADRAAYLNLPLSREEYHDFVEALRAAEKVAPQAFEEAHYFEGCLPIEVMAERGAETLAFGPLKPVGLVDPKTGHRPYAVVQLRQEDSGGTAYGLVGFQTRMTRKEQARVLRTLPGLEQAEFLRFGAVHRNTFLDAPRLLDSTLQLTSDPGLYFAGQIAGTEGYLESAAAGFLCALAVADRHGERTPLLPPPTTALGAIVAHLQSPLLPYQPSNVSFFHVAPWEGARLGKRARRQAMAERALTDLARWMDQRADLGRAQWPGTDAEAGQQVEA